MADEPTKTFSTLAVLTVTTGRFLIRPVAERDNGIGQLYELLGWMTSDEPFTHQLPRFAEECQPWLNRWFPDLATATDEIVRECEAGRFIELLDSLERRFGLTREVPKIPQDDHERKHPLQELAEMRADIPGSTHIIVVEEPPCCDS